MANLARFLINGTPSNPPGFDAALSQVLTFTLEASSSLVGRWTLEVFDAADSKSPRCSKDAPSLNLVGALTGTKVDAPSPSASITTTMPSTGTHTYIVRSTINGGLDGLGRFNAEQVFERIVAIRSDGGRRKIVAGEATQYSSGGWADQQNEDAESGVGGAGPPGPAGIGLDERNPRVTVRVKATGNVNIAAASTTQDGVSAITANYTILLGTQTTPSENGIYVYGTPSGGLAALTRVAALDACRATGDGLRVYVREGTAGTGTYWRAKANNTVVSDTPVGLRPLDVDAEDFYVPADGNDFSAAVSRIQEAFRSGLAFGKVSFKRLPLYTFAAGLLLTTPLEFESNGGPFRTGAVLKFTTSGILVTSGLSGAAAIGAAGATFRGLTLDGNASGEFPVFEHTVQVNCQDVYIQGGNGRGVDIRGSLSDDFSSINTTTTSSFVQPAVGGTVTIAVGTSAGLTINSIIRIGGGGYYKVTAVPNGTSATVRNYGFTSAGAYGLASAAPGATVATSASVRGPLSNTNGSRWDNTRIASTGLTGWRVTGDNANQMVITGLKVSNCGTRAVAGDNRGIDEGSFLGNLYTSAQMLNCTYDAPLAGITTNATFVQPRTMAPSAGDGINTVNVTFSTTVGLTAGQLIALGTASGAGTYEVISVTNGTVARLNCLRQEAGYGDGATVPTAVQVYDPALSIYSAGASNRSHWEDCYTENSDRAYIAGLNTVSGGRVGNLGLAAGFGAASGGGTQINNIKSSTLGQYRVEHTLCPPGSENIQKFSNLNDSSGYDIGWRQATNYWHCIHAGVTTKTAWFLTGSAHAYGGGFMGFNRGLLLAGVRITLDAAANLPANSTAASTYQIGSVIFSYEATGPQAWVVTARAPDTNVGALTWKPWMPFNDPAVAIADSSVTIAVGGGYHYEAAAGLFTANRTTSLGTTGARVGHMLTLVRRDVGAFTWSITNLGAGGGTRRLPGNAWQVYYFDGTNWILRLSGAFPPLKLEAQNFVFSNTLATLTEETKTSTLTGAAVGDTVQASPRTGLPAGITLDYARVSATNTVEIRLYNRSGGSVDCSAITWDVAIVGKV